MTRPIGNPSAPPRRRALAWAAIAALTLLSHAWMGQLFFSLDDFDFIPDADNGLSHDSYLMGGQAPGETDPDALGFAFVIRPVLSLALQLDLALFGASPQAMHWMSILWHLFTCICLLEVLVALRGKAASPAFAWLATLIFAVHPAKMGAVAWISTRGDLMVGTFALAALLALIHYRRVGSKAAIVACFTLMCLAMGSKESGIVVPVLLVICDLAFLRPKKRAAMSFAALNAIVIVGYLSLRYWRLGENMAYYAGETRVMTTEILQRIAASLAPTLACLARGSFLASTQTTVFVLLAVIPCILLLVICVKLGTRLNRLALLVVSIILLISMAPALRFLRESSAVNLSRLFYLPSLPLAVILAWPATIWAQTQSAHRTALNLLGCLVLIACALSFFTEAQLLTKTARHSRTVIEAVNQLAQVQDPTTLIVVEGIPPTIDSSPAIGLFLAKAQRPPFRTEALPILSVWDMKAYLESSGYLLHDGAVLTCKWDATSGKLKQIGDLIERADPAPAPIETRGLHGSIELNASTRGVHHIVFNTDRVGIGKGIDVELELADGTTHAIRLVAEAELATLSRRIFYTRLSDWFVRGGRLKKISYRVETGGPAVTSIAFKLPMEMITWRQPTPNAALSLNGEAPVFRFKAPRTCELFALDLREKGKWRCFFRRDQCTEVGDGVLQWRFGVEGVAMHGHPVLSWQKIAPALRVHLQKQGQGRLNMWAQLLGYEGDSMNPVTQSMTLRFLFTP